MVCVAVLPVQPFQALRLQIGHSTLSVDSQPLAGPARQNENANWNSVGRF